MAVTADEVFAADDRRRERVEVPEWGGYLYVREFSGLTRAAWERRVFDQDGKLRDDSMAVMVVWCAEDDEGQLIFQESDIERLLAEKNADVLYRVANAALRVNGLLATSAEDAAKNSDAGPSA